MKPPLPTYELQPQDKVFFLHIPKTAGVTLGTLLDDHFALPERLPFSLMTDLPTVTLETVQQYRYIRGHFFYDVIRQLLTSPPICLTLLRNPLERFISDFSHLKRLELDQFTNPYHLYRVRGIEQMSLADFVSDSTASRRQVFSNVQTRLLAQKFNFTTCAELNEINLNGYAYDSIDIELAKRLLTEFAFVGLTERFQESLFLLAFTFGWQPVVNFQTLNVSPPRPRSDQIPAETRQKIEEWNALDLELYDYAEQLFQARFTQMTETLLEQYGTRAQAHLTSPLSVESLQALLEKHYERRSAQRQPLVTSLKFEFDQALSGSGWHMIQTLPPCGYVRWTGPGTQTTLDLPLATDQDLSVQFRILMALAPDILDSLTLTVNSQPIPLIRQPDPAGGLIFQGRISQAILQQRPGFTRLAFEVNRTLKPNQVDAQNPDERWLGVLFNWIEISPP